ncbi:glucosamine-6-phosphate deaminase NagB-II [Algicola sagamiensis]|uniref:glucosamine-6-phosphate deaminase NagB-II n=1 Tax=Algicola sagamiensis TaxID=163869 RepID=UPI000368C338|nr:SIS domain-containing protein [Algicola sagamiensis]
MSGTIMEQEAREAPQRLADQLLWANNRFEKLGEKLREISPSMIWVAGRGTSDHAGVFAKYLIEVEAGVPVSLASPSVASIFNRRLDLSGAVAVFISQSGQSLDILAQANMAREQGVYSIAIVNDEYSPLAERVDCVIPLYAGEETAVAATKSCLLTLAALLQIVAHWQQDQTLLAELIRLPDLLDNAVQSSDSEIPKQLTALQSCMVLGRGFGYAISREIALKLKEVCQIHAESFSSAEFIHGPVTLAHQDFHVLDVHIQDETAFVHKQQITEIKRRGATILPVEQPVLSVHPRLAPLTLLQRFYIDIAKVSLSRGMDPDTPVGLKKVTKTL